MSAAKHVARRDEIDPVFIGTSRLDQGLVLEALGKQAARRPFGKNERAAVGRAR